MLGMGVKGQGAVRDDTQVADLIGVNAGRQWGCGDLQPSGAAAWGPQPGFLLLLSLNRFVLIQVLTL